MVCIRIRVFHSVYGLARKANIIPHIFIYAAVLLLDIQNMCCVIYCYVSRISLCIYLRPLGWKGFGNEAVGVDSGSNSEN